MSSDLRGTPLAKDEKKELTKLLQQLRITTTRGSGQVVIHVSNGEVTAFQHGLLFR